MYSPILVKPVEPALLDVAEGLLERFLRRRRSFFPGDPARAACGLRLCDSKRIQNVKTPARRERKNARGDFVRAVATNFRAAFYAESLATSRKKEAQIIVNFRGGSDRRARIARGILLADCDSRGDA